MLLETLSGHLQIANPGGNSTAASIVEPTPSVTSPDTAAASTGVTSVNDGVIKCGAGGGVSPNGLFLLPYGVGTAANTFTLKAYGWNRTIGANSTLPLWIPYLLASFTCTLCTQTGAANSELGTTQKFCGTIALVTGNANVSNEIISPTGNVIASILLDVKSSRFVELRYAIVGTVTSMNCLYGKL